MEDQKQIGPSSNEMDLSAFFSRIGEILASIWRSFIMGIANFRRISIQNAKLLILMAALGVVAGVLYDKYGRRKFYESTMILNSDYINKRTIDNAMEKLNLLSGEPGKNGLIELLNISDSLASNIMSFEAKPFIDENDIIELRILKEQLKNSKLELENPKVIDDVVKRLEIENRHAFEIKVKLYNPRKFKDLEKALVSYIRDNSYVKKRIEITKALNLERKAKLQRESQKLDSLKAVIYDNFRSMADQSRQGSNNVILSDRPVTGPMEVYLRDLTIYNELETVNKSLYLQEDFELVDGFTELNIPSSTRLSTLIVLYALVFIGVGYIIIALRKFNKHLESLA
jgi:hypothetical protein